MLAFSILYLSLLVCMLFLPVTRGQFDANFTLQSVFGRLQTGVRSSIQCTSSYEIPNKIKINRFDTGLGTLLPKHSVQYLQLLTRIFLTRPEDGLLRFGAFQCKMPVRGVVTEVVTLKLPPSDKAELEAENPYMVANRGEEVELNVTINKVLNKVIRWRHNNKDLGPLWHNQTYMKLTNVDETYSGIYEAFYMGRRNESVHALMRLIVRACPAGLFGKECDKECPPCYNGGVCHDKWGVCVCPAGFTGEYCEKACGGNHFGDDCRKYCTPPQNNTNMEDGCALFTFCKPDPYGCSCASGFKGPTCMEHCDAGWYGPDCRQPCHCAYGVKACQRITGYCDGGCANGWRGDSCEIFDPDATAGSLIETTTMTSCSVGKYGAQCEKNCHCANTIPCDVVTGQCPSGCEIGWSGSSCSVCEKGRFGENCESFCHCAGGHTMCDKEGYCFTGCDAGWAGFTCQQECTDGRFGHNCASTCHCLADTDICNKETGECTGDCQPGFMGKNCQTLCSSNTYGINCQHTCTCLNSGLCNRVLGTCACEGRWRGQVCNESMPEIIATTDEEANIGQMAFISCTADAVPPPEMNLASIYFPGLPFNLRALDKNQFQAVMKIVPDKAGEFNFSCSAKNSHGFDRKIIIFSAFAPPVLTRPPEVIEKTDISIMVKWDAWLFGEDSGGKPDDNIEYMILYRELFKLEWQQHGGWTGNLNATIRNLLPYQDYEISVKCKRPNKGGEGIPGPYTMTKTLCGNPLPNAIPHHFLPDEMSPDFVRLTWKNPTESLLKCKLVGYNLLYFPDSEGSSENTTGMSTLSIHTVATEVVLDDIPPNSLYKFHLYPVTTTGQLKYYAELTFRTTELVPGPVIDLEYELTEGTDMLLVKWKNPTIRNGLIKAYNVTYELTDRGHCGRSSQDKDLPGAFSILTTETKAVIVDIVPYSTYTITVAAQTASGEGDPSLLTVHTMEAAPAVGPPNVRPSLITGTSIEFEWDPIPCESANGVITEYEYHLVTSSLTPHERKRRSSDLSIGFEFVKVKGLKTLLTGLTPSIEYGFAVRGYTRVDAGSFTEFVFVRTKDGVPPPPHQFIIDAVTSSHITVSWLKPDSFHGRIQSYKIRYWPTKDLEQFADIVINATDGDNTSKRLFRAVGNLRGAVNYVFKIQACSITGCGNWSDELLGRTRDGLPEAPLEVTLLDCSETTLKITWKSPTVTNGLITGYKITYQPKNSLDSAYRISSRPPKESVVNGDVTMAILDLLHPSTQYSVKVQARTSIGYGPATEHPCWTTIKGVHILPSVRTVNMEATNETIPIIFSTEEKSKVFKYQVIVEFSRNAKFGINESLLTDFTKAVEQNGLPYYIAAELDPANLSKAGQQSFIVGDKKMWGGYQNVHLNPGHSYRIRIRTLIKNNNEIKSVLSEPKEQVAETTMTHITGKERTLVLGLDLVLFIILVIAFLVLMFIIAFVTVLAIYRKRERQRKRRSAAFCNRDSGLSESLTWSVMYRASESEASGGPLVCDGWKYTSTIDKSTLKKSKTYAKNCQGIPIDDLTDYVYDQNNAARLAEEFKQLVSGQTAAWTLARKSENLKRNRYGNILPYDRSRVVLQLEPNISDSDYINASFIDGYRRQKEYIITQGPLDCTIVDLWRMVWQENAPLIIMLTDQVENGKKKCSKYWPDDSMTSGNLNILNIFSEECVDFTIRTLLMRKINEGRTHRVLHYQFTGWPDRTVPLNSYFLLKMIKRVRSDNPVLGGPMIVHCSAGAGRSGTYVALDALIQQAQEEKQVDIFRFVNNARLQRINLVQTMEQYMFIHEALLDAVSSEDSIIPLHEVAHHLLDMRQSSTLNPKSVIRKQFQLLKHSQKRFDVTHCSVALSETNIFKNRDPMTVPADVCRVRLRNDLDSPNCFDDYINAIYVDSYRKKNRFIVTQTPLNHTVEDFWKLVNQSKSSLIVMLNEVDGCEENIGQYWPSEGESRYGNLEVQLVSFEEREEFTIQIMKLIKHDQLSTECRKITQLQCNTWYAGQPVPADAGALLRFMQVVEMWYQRTDGGPIVVHCMDGATRCGLFCTVSHICEQIEEEKVLDAQQAVKNTRSNRPEFVSSLEQFVFCFEVANAFCHMDFAFNVSGLKV